MNWITQPDSVHTVEDALAHISQPQPVQVGQSSLSASEASHQVHIDVLPSILVLRLKKRLLYDEVKTNKPVQFAPELEFPLGTIFFFISPC